MQSTFDWPLNQSNLIKYNCLIGFRLLLIESIEQSWYQSNFPKFFVIDSMSARLPSITFHCIRFMKIFHSPFWFFFLLLIFSLWIKKNNFFPLWKLRNQIGCLKSKKIKKIWLTVLKALFWVFKGHETRWDIGTILQKKRVTNFFFHLFQMRIWTI